MNDLIDRQTAIDEINKLEYPSSLVDVKRIIVGLPSAQPERKTGRWVGNPECDEFMTCSACGCEFDWVSEGGYPSSEWGYCPECGAFMGGEQDDDNGTDRIIEKA